jgi:hypothetical protein
MNSSARLMAVTSHGDHENELPLMWGICSALVEFGFAVTVLDGTVEEQVDGPGLMQILDIQHWQMDVQADKCSCSVLPAAIGLKRICQISSNTKMPLEQLKGLFESGHIVIVFAHGDLLSQLLAKSAIQPLLAVSSATNSLMTAYQALKQMHLAAQIHPLIVTISHESASHSFAPATLSGQTLHDCARNFLGCNLRSPGIAILDSGDTTSPNMSQLVTQMLETAMPLACHMQATPTLRGTRPQAPLSGSH